MEILRSIQGLPAQFRRIKQLLTAFAHGARDTLDIGGGSSFQGMTIAYPTTRVAGYDEGGVMTLDSNYPLGTVVEFFIGGGASVITDIPVSDCYTSTQNAPAKVDLSNCSSQWLRTQDARGNDFWVILSVAPILPTTLLANASRGYTLGSPVT